MGRAARLALATLGSATLLLGAPASHGLAATSSGLAAGDQQAFLQRVVDLTNQQRASQGLAPLSLNPQLEGVAEGYSQILAQGGCMAHTCGPVPNMVDRDTQAGYGDWSNLGENIAAGFSTPDAVVTGWMNSPEHRANILNPAYTEIGVGVSQGAAPYTWYWTQEFGAQFGATAAAASPAFMNVVPDPQVSPDGSAPDDANAAPDDGGDGS